MWYISEELIAGFGGALIGAMVSGVFAWFLHTAEQLRAAREELRHTLAELVEVREEAFRTSLEHQGAMEQAQASGLYNAKRALLLENAENIVSKIPRHVSSSQYFILASEHVSVSNFVTAEKYFRKSVAVSRTLFYRTVALRSLGDFYFTVSPLQNVEQGRKYFAEAIKLLESQNDEYSCYGMGFTYESWGLAEIYNGFVASGEELVLRAQACYHRLSDVNPTKKVALESLALRQQSLLQTPTAGDVMHLPGTVTPGAPVAVGGE
jgi:tetratricopeptide (TPR) repeat protein